MKIRLLNSKANSYQLCSSFEKIDFNLEEVSFLKIQKKHCFLSIVYILFFSISASYLICNYFSLSLFFLFMTFFIISFYLVIIFYKHSYTIDITIHSERISFETKDKDLVNDFFMLHYFYNEMEVNVLKPC